MQSWLSRVFICVLSICFVSKVGWCEERIRIGISAGLTGPAATFGADLKNIVAFANQKVAGGAYELVVEDDHCDGRGAVAVAHKLIAVDKVQAVYFACDTAAIAAAPIYKAAGVLVLSSLVTTPHYSELGDTFFRIAPNDADNAGMLYAHVVTRYKKIGILTEQSTYCEDLAAEFKKQSGKGQLKIVEEKFAPEQRDFKTLLLKLKREGIDSLFINTTTEEPFVAILRQLRELHIELPKYGSYEPGSASFLKMAGSLAEGIIYTDFPSLMDVMRPFGEPLFKEYVAQYGPLNSWDAVFATTYELFSAMHEAMNRSTTTEGRAQFLHDTKFHGLIGAYHFSAHGDASGVKNDLRSIRDGKPVSEF